jgi:dihydropteroate synthase
VQAGVHFFRVHDVLENVQAAGVARAWVFGSDSTRVPHEQR